MVHWLVFSRCGRMAARALSSWLGLRIWSDFPAALSLFVRKIRFERKSSLLLFLLAASTLLITVLS